MSEEDDRTSALSVNETVCHLCLQDNLEALIWKQLYSVYSSSQNYYYTKEINEIIEESLTPCNIRFEDNQYYDDEEEFLKRSYGMPEYSNKLFNINQYYYYHRDSPRMFHSRISKPYNRWQDHRKSYLYRRLKKMLNEPSSQSQSMNYQPENEDIALPINVLFDLSDYNPYSRNYYLRKKAREEQQKAKPPEPSNVTQNAIENLKRLLTGHSNSFSELSIHDVSTTVAPQPKSPQRQTSTKLSEPYHTINSKAMTRYDFKKKKIIIGTLGSQTKSSTLNRQGDSKPKILAFRKSQQQIVINHTPQLQRLSVPIITVSEKKHSRNPSLQNKPIKSTSLKNVRIRMQKNTPSVAKINTKKNDSTREFCDEKIIQRVESYRSQQMPSGNTVLKMKPGEAKQATHLEKTRRASQIQRAHYQDDTLNKILLRRYEGK